jgi:hypothetical protein
MATFGVFAEQDAVLFSRQFATLAADPGPGPEGGNDQFCGVLRRANVSLDLGVFRRS